MREPFTTGQLTFGVKRVTIPPGTTRRWCAEVQEPYVSSDRTVNQIYVSWDDRTDYGCGRIEVSVQQSFDPFLSRGPAIGSGGNLRYTKASFFKPECPECVKRGIYIVTATGVALANPDDPECEKFHVTWGVQ